MAVPPEAKTIVTTAGPLWTANLGWGWFNKYYFRGVDILKAVSPAHPNSGVVTSKLTLGYSREKDAFSIGFGNVQALERQLPKGAALAVKPNNTVRIVGKGKNPADTFVPKKDNERFNLPPTERYGEYNLYLAYTRELIAKKLQGTVNFNRYQFSDGSFYESGGGPIRYADETTVRLDYIGLPIVHPSIAWSHDFDGFIGDFLEFRLDGGFDIFERGSFDVRLEPYVAVSYDLKYNGADNGWNALEFGLTAPVHLNDTFTLTFTGNYTQQLEDSNGQPRTNNGFWGGVVLNAVWGNRSKPKPLPGSSPFKDTDKMIAIPGEDKPWAISTGVGWRNVDYDFQHRSIGSFNVDPDTGSLFRRRTGKGDIGFATAAMKKVYDDGAVFAATAQSSPGTAGFKISKSSQVTGDPATSSNAQVAFSTTDFAYRQQHTAFSRSSDDQDSVVSPYVALNREVWRSGSWSVRAGLLYSFTYTEGDGGVRLAQLDSLFQHRDQFNYVYAFDEVRTNVTPGDGFTSKTLPGGQVASVVVDANLYATNAYGVGGVTTTPSNLLFGTSPQKTRDTIDVEKLRIATFVKTEVDVSAHDIALPVTFRHDFGKRLHAEISAAATLTVVNADIHTDIERRDLNNKFRVVNVAAAVTQPQGTIAPPNSPLRNRPTLPSRTSPPPPVPPRDAGGGNDVTNLGGGKSGANVKEAQLPGRSVDRRGFDSSTSDLLVGFAGTISMILDLNEEGTFYAELWGRYHWVDDLNVGNGRGTTTIDLSGFQGGVGLGVRF